MRGGRQHPDGPVRRVIGEASRPTIVIVPGIQGRWEWIRPAVDALAEWATVFDCVYVPATTPLLAAARARGLQAANGSEMLVAQAAAAFERWTGVGGMADVMRAAVAPLLADPDARA